MKTNKKAGSGILGRIRNNKWTKRIAAAVIGAIGMSSAASANTFEPTPVPYNTGGSYSSLFNTFALPAPAAVNTLLTAPQLQGLMDRAYARGASGADVLALQKAVFTESESTEWDSDLGTRTRTRAALTMARLQRGEVIMLTPAQSGQQPLTTASLTAGTTLTERVTNALGEETAPTADAIRDLQEEVGLPQTGRATPVLGQRLRDAMARENGTTSDAAALEAVERFIDIRGPQRLSSQFGPRPYVTAGASRIHPAVDVASPYGTAVALNSDGCTITDTSRSSVTWRCINGDEALGMRGIHFSRVSARPGAAADGTPIANIGSEGISTGPHIHWTLTDTMGDMIDPTTYTMTDNVQASERIAAMLMQGRGSNDAGFDAFAGMSNETRLSFNQPQPRVELASLTGPGALFGSTSTSSLFGSPFGIAYGPTGPFGFASTLRYTVPSQNVTYLANNNRGPSPMNGDTNFNMPATYERRFVL